MAASSSQSKFESIEVNKKARRDYEIIETLEAGISLLGSELKSIRQGGISLQESYVQVTNGECFLVHAHVSPYAFTSVQPPDPYRSRKLLLHKREIEKLAIQVQRKGLTIVPLRVYINPRGKVKVEIGLGRGKKIHDKRADIKNKESARDLERALKRKM
jgi:SsrA-binding protein